MIATSFYTADESPSAERLNRGLLWGFKAKDSHARPAPRLQSTALLNEVSTSELSRSELF